MKTYAIPASFGPVQAQHNPNLDAPQRHALYEPMIAVPAIIEGQSGRLFFKPYANVPGSVQITSGPRRWWDRDDGFMDPVLPLAPLSAIADGTAQHRAIEIPEEWGLRTFLAATVVLPRRFRSPQTMIQLSIGRASHSGLVSWSAQHSDAALISEADLAQACRFCERVHTAGEIIDRPDAV
jgi:hypothetical protein